MEIQTHGRLISDKVTGIVFCLLFPQSVCVSKNKI